MFEDDLQEAVAAINFMKAFAKNANLSNGVFKVETRMPPLVQGKCNKMVTSAMPAFHHSKNKNSKNSINFFSH